MYQLIFGIGNVKNCFWRFKSNGGQLALLTSIPYKFYVLGQIGLIKQCRPRSDCF